MKSAGVSITIQITLCVVACRFPQGGVSWFNKRVEQRFPETEAEAALFWNGSTKADPEKKGKTSMFYIVNEDEKNR